MTANSKDRELPTHAKPLAMQRLFCGVAGVEGLWCSSAAKGLAKSGAISAPYSAAVNPSQCPTLGPFPSSLQVSATVHGPLTVAVSMEGLLRSLDLFDSQGPCRARSQNVFFR